MTQVTLKQDGKTLTALLSGEIDHHWAAILREKIDERAAAAAPAILILDFSAVTFMDSSGIGVVLGRYRLLCLRGGSVALMHLTPQVRRIYDLSGMAQIIPVIEEKEAQGCN